MEKYLTSEQVAEMLQVHQITVLKYLKSGVLPGIKIGRMYRIKESEVEEFLENKTIVKGKKSKPKEEPKSEPPPKQEPKPEPKPTTKEKKEEYYLI